MDLNSQNISEDIIENRSEILTASSPCFSDNQRMQGNDASPIVSEENASLPQFSDGEIYSGAELTS